MSEWTQKDEARWLKEGPQWFRNREDMKSWLDGFEEARKLLTKTKHEEFFERITAMRRKYIIPWEHTG